MKAILVFGFWVVWSLGLVGQDGFYELSAELNGGRDSQIKWSFQKYLISEKGELVEVLDPIKQPDCEEVLDWIGF